MFAASMLQIEELTEPLKFPSRIRVSVFFTVAELVKQALWLFRLSFSCLCAMLAKYLSTTLFPVPFWQKKRVAWLLSGDIWHGTTHTFIFHLLSLCPSFFISYFPRSLLCVLLSPFPYFLPISRFLCPNTFSCYQFFLSSKYNFTHKKLSLRIL